MNDLEVAAFSELVSKPNVVVLDVRTPQEYADGHLNHSILIDYYEPDFKSKIESLDKNKTYAVYCRSGHRSGEATDLMAKMGFQEVFNLKGGIIDWKDSGKEITLRETE